MVSRSNNHIYCTPARQLGFKMFSVLSSTLRILLVLMSVILLQIFLEITAYKQLLILYIIYYILYYILYYIYIHVLYTICYKLYIIIIYYIQSSKTRSAFGNADLHVQQMPICQPPRTANFCQPQSCSSQEEKYLFFLISVSMSCE